MKCDHEEGEIKHERTAQRKQAKRQRKADGKAKREAEFWGEVKKELQKAGITLCGQRTAHDDTESKRRIEEAERDFTRQADELAARVKATIEADRAAGRETDLWEWLKDAPCLVTKALRERGISLGKHKK